MVRFRNRRPIVAELPRNCCKALRMSETKGRSRCKNRSVEVGIESTGGREEVHVQESARSSLNNVGKKERPQGGEQSRIRSGRC